MTTTTAAGPTAATDLAHLVLLRVAEFVRALKPDQLAELADGTAKLQVAPKSGAGRSAARPRTAGARGRADLPKPAAEIGADLVAFADRPTITRHLERDLKLTVPLLKQLAAELGIALTGKATKADILGQIATWALRGANSTAISTPTAARQR